LLLHGTRNEHEVNPFLKRFQLNGTVFSGRGEGAIFITLPWVSAQIEEKLGFMPFPGTLNVKLTAGSVKTKEILENSGGIQIHPDPGYCRAKLFRARMEGLDCAVVLPGVSDYPEDVIEVVASENLRKRFGLVDGNTVKVEVIV
jgi:riboflavin kinase